MSACCADGHVPFTAGVYFLRFPQGHLIGICASLHPVHSMLKKLSSILPAASLTASIMLTQPAAINADTAGGISQRISTDSDSDSACHPENRMSRLADSLKLTGISIPGSNNSNMSLKSRASGFGSFMPGTWRCRNNTITEQPRIGLRFLDMRVKLQNGRFIMRHGDSQSEGGRIVLLKRYPDNKGTFLKFTRDT